MSLYLAAHDKKVIFLDLDNTLYAYQPCHQQGLKAAYRYYRLHIETTSYRKFVESYHSARTIIHGRLRSQAAVHSRLLYFQTLLEKRFGKTDFKHTLKLERVYWVSFLKRMRLASWVRPFLKYCRENKKCVVIVTNLTAEIQFKKIKTLRLSRWIDYMISSEEAGVEKPDKAFFKLAVGKVSVHARDVLLIDDEIDHCEFGFEGIDKMKKVPVL